MKHLRTCPTPVDLSRRDFLRRTLTTTAIGAATAASFEERHLLAAAETPASAPAAATAKLPTGKIRHLEISRLICGGNLITGYAHSRDLIYVSPLLNHYFTDEKILDTWQMCETHGINTMIVHPNDERAVALYQRYRKERSRRLQWLAQASPDEQNMATIIKRAVDDNAVGVFLVGNQGDRWTFDKRLDLIGQFVELVNQQGVISGVGGHSLEMVQAVEAAGIKNDFYMKTLHTTKYWSARRPDQTKPVIENYATDNYFDLAPDKTIAQMKTVKKPWIAYKVLAAGAIHPRVGFDFAFANGADFACVGMFDFQVAENVATAAEILPKYEERGREWFA
jgi:hypothetical protein